MCVNYTPSRKDLFEEKFGAAAPDADWKNEIWQDYPAPIIRHDARGQRQAVLASYSMLPKARLPPGVKRFSTMNARAETLAQLRSYSQAWRAGQLCLVPMQHFFEPSYESGRAERWQIGLKDASDFAVAGLYKEWREQDQLSYSFTQITINADQHPLMQRFHKLGEEKRSLVILPAQSYDAWLACKDPQLAGGFLQLYPAELMHSQAALKAPGSALESVASDQTSFIF
jgi:putative SOS response-associated peptidase YedK